MKFILMALCFALPVSAHALEAIKCNTLSGKTLWAGFGKITRSGEPEPVYYPIEFTVFKSHSELQDRVYFERTKDALAIKVSVTRTSVEFDFPARNGDEVQTESFKLRLYSPQDDRAYVGQWSVIRADGGVKAETIYCSVYR